MKKVSLEFWLCYAKSMQCRLHKRHYRLQPRSWSCESSQSKVTYRAQTCCTSKSCCTMVNIGYHQPTIAQLGLLTHLWALFNWLATAHYKE